MARTMAARAVLLLALAVALLEGGCGYGLRGRRNPWAAQGIYKVYIRTLTNNTLKAGVEIPITSALVREFARGGRLKVVNSEEDADAIISGAVNSFGSTIGPMVSVSQLAPQDPQAQALRDMVIAAEYVAQANVDLSLVSKAGSQLWSGSFNRPKVYPAGNRFGLQGTTSALINASQESIALDEIAEFIASDAHDTMLEAF